MKLCPRCKKDSLAVVACGNCKHPSISIPCQKCRHPSLKPLKCGNCLFILMPSMCPKCNIDSNECMKCQKCKHYLIPSITEEREFRPFEPSISQDPRDNPSFARFGKAKVTRIEPEKHSQEEKCKEEAKKTIVNYQVEVPFVVKYPQHLFESSEKCTADAKSQRPCTKLSGKTIDTSNYDFEKLKSIPQPPICPNTVQRGRNTVEDETNHENISRSQKDKEKQEITADKKMTGICKENLGISMKNKDFDIFLTNPKLVIKSGDSNAFPNKCNDVIASKQETTEVRKGVFMENKSSNVSSTNPNSLPKNNENNRPLHESQHDKLKRNTIATNILYDKFSGMEICDSENINVFSQNFNVNHKAVLKCGETSAFSSKHDDTNTSNPKSTEVREPKSVEVHAPKSTEFCMPKSTEAILNSRFHKCIETGGECLNMKIHGIKPRISFYSYNSIPDPQTIIINYAEQFKSGEASSFSSRPGDVGTSERELSYYEAFFRRPEVIQILKENNRSAAAVSSKSEAVKVSKVEQHHSNACSSRSEVVDVCKDEKSQVNTFSNAHKNISISKDKNTSSTAFSSIRYEADKSNKRDIRSDALSSRPEDIKIFKNNTLHSKSFSRKHEDVKISKGRVSHFDLLISTLESVEISNNENPHSEAFSSKPEEVELFKKGESHLDLLISEHESAKISKDEKAFSRKPEKVKISKEGDSHSDLLISKHKSAELSKDEKPHSEAISSKPENVKISKEGEAHSYLLISEHESAQIFKDGKPHSEAFSGKPEEVEISKEGDSHFDLLISKHESAEFSKDEKPHSEAISSKPEEVEISKEGEAHSDLLTSKHESAELSKDEKPHSEAISSKPEEVKISKEGEAHSDLLLSEHEAAVIFKQENFQSNEFSDRHNSVEISKGGKCHSDLFSKNLDDIQISGDKGSDSIVLNKNKAVEISNNGKSNLYEIYQMKDSEKEVHEYKYECHSMRIDSFAVYPTLNNSRIKVIFTRDTISFNVSDVENSKYTIAVNLKSCDIDFARIYIETATTVVILEMSSNFMGYLKKLFPMLENVDKYIDLTSKDDKEQNKIIFWFDSMADELQSFLCEFLGVNKVKDEMLADFPYQPSSPNSQPKISVIVFADDPYGSIQINDDDRKCLPENTYLNDTIIDLYAKYIYWERISEDKRAKVHIFNSQFHQFLTARMKNTHQKGIKCWTKHVDIFLKDYIVIPLNRRKHWFLAIVCFPGLIVSASSKLESSHSASEASALVTKTTTRSRAKSELKGIGRGKRSLSDRSISAFDCEKMNILAKRMKLQEEKWPCIYFFNSTRKYNVNPERIASTIRRFLEMEWEVKKGYKVDFNAENLPTIKVPSPQQDNEYDCGLYILQYMLTFLKDPVHYNGKTIPNLSRWFTPKAVSPMRMEIKDLIMRKLDEVEEQNAKSS